MRILQHITKLRSKREHFFNNNNHVPSLAKIGLFIHKQTTRNINPQTQYQQLLT